MAIVALTALMLAQAAPVAKPGGSSAQRHYEAAVALDAAGTPAQRAAAWHAFAEEVRGNRRSLALARVHEGAALVVDKRIEEGEPLLRRGYGDLPAGDATLRGERYDAAALLAALAERRLDYAAAAPLYAAAEPLAQSPGERLTVLLGIIRTATYTDPAVALAAIGRADALMATVAVAPHDRGMVRRFDAELRLNRGDVAGARTQAAAAVKLMGGMTDRTDSDDVSVRSDYAIASLLLGDTDTARQYMAMTGAGRMPNGLLGRGVDTPLPDCGGEAQLKPDDLAVVEFTVADDGRTVGVRPVYAAGGGAAALEFARSVADWSWTPEQMKRVPPFFRYRVRLELRCSTSFQRPSVSAYLDTRLGRWLGERAVEMPPVPVGSDAAVLPAERALLAATEQRAGKDALALVPVLHLLVRNRVVLREERHAAAVRELALLEAHQAPASVRLDADLAAGSDPDGEGRVLDRLRPRYAGDPEAAGALALAMADDQRRDDARARALLRPVAEDKALAADNPVRSAALIRLASLEQAAGHGDAARALYADAHVPPESCAMIDAEPHLLRAGGVFPTEAARWGFEGWTMTQFDISPSGQTSNIRVVMAYPPFVFSKAGIGTMTGARYAKTFRPDGQTGCGGATGNVRFMMPGG